MKHFFLEPPSGFQPLDWHREIRRYQRNLPHWRQTGATYFVTFRLADSLPREAIRYLQNLREEWREKYRNMPLDKEEISFRKYARIMNAAEEKWLDQGIGSCMLRNRDIAAIVESKLHKFHEIRYQLGAYIIVPNHVHAIVRPLDETSHDLDDITKGWKGIAAREINKKKGTTGRAIWQEESFDTIIRDADHLYQVVQYIGRNPEKARIKKPWRRWVCEEWKDMGYDFATNG